MESIFLNFIIAFAIVLIHEFGHYIAGLFVGIPRELIKVVMHKIPQHVALKDENGSWLSPLSGEKYIRTFMHLVSGKRNNKAYILVAGGFVGETIISVSIIGLLLLTSFRGLSYSMAMMSLILVIIYLILDALITLIARKPVADTSALFSINKAVTVVLVPSIVAVKVLVFIALQ